MANVRTRSRTSDVKAAVAVGEAEQAVSELSQVMNQFQKVHGSNAFSKASDMQQFLHIPTDIFTLDLGLLGGVAKSLITMPYGWESCGKTYICMKTIAQAQRLLPEQKVVLVEPEGTYDPVWGEVNGIDNDELLVGRCDTGEQSVDLAVAALEARDTGLLILDSIPALVPAKEQEKSIEDDIVALQARLTGRFVRKAMHVIVTQRKRDHLPALMLVNQFRNKIVMMGDPNTLPGGNALKYFVGVRFQMYNKEMMDGDRVDSVVDHNQHSFKITKNKAGNGVRQGEFKLIRNPEHPRGVGFVDEGATVITFARKLGLCTGGGSSWRLMGVDQKFSKLDEMVQYVYGQPDYYRWMKYELICRFRESMGQLPRGWHVAEAPLLAMSRELGAVTEQAAA
jgi:recombination protein RecA